MNRKEKEHASEDKRTLNQLTEKYTPILQDLQQNGQKYKVLNHMLTNGSITSMEAFRRYRITRISAVIFDLRAMGVDIETEMVTKKRKGETLHYGVYRVA